LRFWKEPLEFCASLARFFIFAKIKREPLNKHVPPFSFQAHRPFIELYRFWHFRLAALGQFTTRPSCWADRRFLTSMVLKLPADFIKDITFIIRVWIRLYRHAIRGHSKSRECEFSGSGYDDDFLSWHSPVGLLALSIISIVLAFIFDKNAIRPWIRLLQSPGSIRATTSMIMGLLRRCLTSVV
jgi:hypothetical protein